MLRMCTSCVVQYKIITTRRELACVNKKNLNRAFYTVQGRQSRGVGGSQPPLNFGRGVEPPLIFRKICVEILKSGLFLHKFLKSRPFFNRIA